MIVTAFAASDRRQLRSLLSREVFDGFDTAITERKAAARPLKTRFVSIDGSTITGAELRKARHKSPALRLEAGFRYADRAGAVIDGNAEKVTDVTDV